MKNKKTYFNLKRNCLLVLVSLSSAVLLYSLFHIAYWMYENHNTSQEMDKISNMTTINDMATNNLESEKAVNDTEIPKFDPYWDFIKMNYLEVDFSNLLKENNEVVAWVSVNGTNINYPIVKHSDNEYYLNHSFNKVRNSAGWVFMDYRNRMDSLSKNTIIYAHGRQNGSMFGSLKNILNSNWYQDSNNYVVKLSTEYENSLWQVFSVYRIPTTNDYIQTDFNSDTSYQQFLEKISTRSAFDFKTTVGINDKVLTLSTCYNDSDKVVMHAKLIKIQKR